MKQPPLALLGMGACAVAASLFAVTGAHGVVSVVPMDYVYWSASLEKLMSGANADRKAMGDTTPAELWITGSASKLATKDLADLGWKVVPKVAVRLGQ
jgi:hypothetical protein